MTGGISSSVGRYSMQLSSGLHYRWIQEFKLLPQPWLE